jgi:hypothetical protein
VKVWLVYSINQPYLSLINRPRSDGLMKGKSLMRPKRVDERRPRRLAMCNRPVAMSAAFDHIVCIARQLDGLTGEMERGRFGHCLISVLTIERTGPPCYQRSELHFIGKGYFRPA